MSLVIERRTPDELVTPRGRSRKIWLNPTRKVRKQGGRRSRKPQVVTMRRVKHELTFKLADSGAQGLREGGGSVPMKKGSRDLEQVHSAKEQNSKRWRRVTAGSSSLQGRANKLSLPLPPLCLKTSQPSTLGMELQRNPYPGVLFSLGSSISPREITNNTCLYTGLAAHVRTHGISSSANVKWPRPSSNDVTMPRSPSIPRTSVCIYSQAGCG